MSTVSPTMSCGQSCQNWYNGRVRWVAQHTTRHVEKLTLGNEQCFLSKVMAVFAAAVLSVALVPWALLSATVSCAWSFVTCRLVPNSQLRMPHTQVPVSAAHVTGASVGATENVVNTLAAASDHVVADILARGPQSAPPAANSADAPVQQAPAPRASNAAAELAAAGLHFPLPVSQTPNVDAEAAAAPAPASLDEARNQFILNAMIEDLRGRVSSLDSSLAGSASAAAAPNAAALERLNEVSSMADRSLAAANNPVVPVLSGSAADIVESLKQQGLYVPGLTESLVSELATAGLSFPLPSVSGASAAAGAEHAAHSGAAGASAFEAALFSQLGAAWQGAANAIPADASREEADSALLAAVSSTFPHAVGAAVAAAAQAGDTRASENGISAEVKARKEAAISEMIKFMGEQGIRIAPEYQGLLKPYFEFMLLTDEQADEQPAAELAEFARDILQPALPADKVLAFEAKAEELFAPFITGCRQTESAAAGAAAAGPARRRSSWFRTGSWFGTGSTDLSLAAATAGRISDLQDKVAAITSPRRRAGTQETAAMVADLRDFATKVGTGAAAVAEGASTPVRAGRPPKAEAPVEKDSPVDDSAGASTDGSGGTGEEEAPSATAEVKKDDGAAAATKPKKKRRPSMKQQRLARKQASADRAAGKEWKKKAS